MLVHSNAWSSNLVPVQGHYRGRLAPSPTGLLHLGHARTFWIAYRRALASCGTLVLRNENLDPQRSKPDFARAMIEDLLWLGIAWQEGPDLGGEYAPYVQSERRPLYLAAWRSLVTAGRVYPCSCTRRELAANVGQERVQEGVQEGEQEGVEDGGEPGELLYSGRCRPAAGTTIEVPEGPEGFVWRLRVPDQEVVAFEDGHFGAQTYTAGRDFGDFPIWRRDDVPSYQLACVVDDAAMRVTEVVRGADLLMSTARQLLLYRALGLAAPAFFHCPLVRDAEGRRWAKRTDALSLRALRERGHTPEEVLIMAGFPEGSR